MQHGKLYSLHTATYFITALTVFKIDNILSSQIGTTRKKSCFHTQRIISLFHHLICFIERKTKYTTKCSVKSSTIYTVKLIVIVFRKRKFYVANVRDAQNLIPQNFIDFESKKYSYKISSRM